MGGLIPNNWLSTSHHLFGLFSLPLFLSSIIIYINFSVIPVILIYYHTKKFKQKGKKVLFELQKSILLRNNSHQFIGSFPDLFSLLHSCSHIYTYAWGKESVRIYTKILAILWQFPFFLPLCTLPPCFKILFLGIPGWLSRLSIQLLILAQIVISGS